MSSTLLLFVVCNNLLKLALWPGDRIVKLASYQRSPAADPRATAEASRLVLWTDQAGKQTMHSSASVAVRARGRVMFC